MTSPDPVPPQTPPALRALPGAQLILRSPKPKRARPPIDGHALHSSYRQTDVDAAVQGSAAARGGVVQAGRITSIHLQSPAEPLNKFAPEVSTSASELQATSVAEFLDLLRELVNRSGANRKQLAERSGIPTSTVYHLLSPKTVSLPSKSQQVRALAAACGLTRDQLERVMQLWVELRNPPPSEIPTSGSKIGTKPWSEIDWFGGDVPEDNPSKDVPEEVRSKDVPEENRSKEVLSEDAIVISRQALWKIPISLVVAGAAAACTFVGGKESGQAWPWAALGALGMFLAAVATVATVMSFFLPAKGRYDFPSTREAAGPSRGRHARP